MPETHAQGCDHVNGIEMIVSLNRFSDALVCYFVFHGNVQTLTDDPTTPYAATRPATKVLMGFRLHQLHRTDVILCLALKRPIELSPPSRPSCL
jgi:hypothetical protein